MGSVRQRRARLPRRVYWVRRGLVLVVALLMVLGIAKLFGGTGADDQPADVRAKTTSAEQTPSASISMGPVAPSKKLHTKAKVPLLPPSGDCLDDEVGAVPSVEHAWAGAPITIKVALTGTQPACTFDVSPESVVVKIVLGDDRIWSSQDCPRSIPTTQVVIRSGQPADVPVTWSGRRSDDQCTTAPDWATLGFYHVYAAALGSTPTDAQFEVTRGPTVRVTHTPKARPSSSGGPGDSAAKSPSPKVEPTKKPSKKPSKKP